MVVNEHVDITGRKMRVGDYLVNAAPYGGDACLRFSCVVKLDAKVHVVTPWWVRPVPLMRPEYRLIINREQVPRDQEIRLAILLVKHADASTW